MLTAGESDDIEEAAAQGVPDELENRKLVALEPERSALRGLVARGVVVVQLEVVRVEGPQHVAQAALADDLVEGLDGEVVITEPQRSGGEIIPDFYLERGGIELTAPDPEPVEVDQHPVEGAGIHAGDASLVGEVKPRA